MNINWHSNAPFVSTGYGNQTKLFTPRIKKLGYEVSITSLFGLQAGIIGFTDGISIYPSGKHPYGQDIIGASAAFNKADIIITLFDIWPIEPHNIPSNIAWFPWFPVDCEPVAKPVIEKARCARKGITMSKFGQKMAEQAGLDTFYIPHGVDTSVFNPGDRNAALERIKWPKDKFIVGMVAANKGIPARKSFCELIIAFAALHKAHPDTMLYLHTDDGTRGGDLIDLKAFCELLGLRIGYHTEQGLSNDIDVAFPEQYTYTLGLNDLFLVDAYNVFDVSMLVSMGEGFGIPLIESQACGCPVITAEWTSMGELCLSGWKIPKSDARQNWNPYSSAWQWSVNPEAVTDRLMAAYEMRGNMDYRSRARDGALQYDADRVTEKYWKPILSDIEEMIDASKSKMELVTF